MDEEVFGDGYLVCNWCGISYPQTSKYWYKSRSKKGGYLSECKKCVQKACKKKNHYRKYSREDILERGILGAKCFFWAPRCGNCIYIEEDLYDDESFGCWRMHPSIGNEMEHPVPIWHPNKHSK